MCHSAGALMPGGVLRWQHLVTASAVLRRTLVPTQHLVHKLQNTHDKDNNQGFLSPLTVRRQTHYKVQSHETAATACAAVESSRAGSLPAALRDTCQLHIHVTCVVNNGADWFNCKHPNSQ